MTTTHNHPPRCCCAFARDVDAYEPTTPCPLCPEHGELAQLGNDNPPNAIPANVTWHRTSEHDAHETWRCQPELCGSQPTQYPAEYPCCHQLAGRPHTDYCPDRFNQPDADEMTRAGIALGMTHTPTAGTRGTATDRLHIGASLTPGATIPTHERHTCHPDRCGMWATTTTQPPTQTSTPPTEARTHPVGPRSQPGAHHAPDCVRRTNPNAVCICGREGEREPTPLATPTPRVCASCLVDVTAGPAPYCQWPHNHTP